MLHTSLDILNNLCYMGGISGVRFKETHWLCSSFMRKDCQAFTLWKCLTKRLNTHFPYHPNFERTCPCVPVIHITFNPLPAPISCASLRTMEADRPWGEEAVRQGVPPGLPVYRRQYAQTRGPACHQWCGPGQGRWCFMSFCCGAR